PTMDEYQGIQAIGLAEKVEIISTDDEKIKSVGELLSSDSGRNILKLLFDQVLTANQIAQKTEISLPLVIYHLKKMQDMGIVKITNIGKNIKTQDMKFYTSSKFAIVILPSNVTEKAKTSKSLANSFKAIYRFGAIGIAAIGSWFATIAFQGTGQISDITKGIPEGSHGGGYTSYNPFYNAVGGPYSGDGGTGSGASLEEMLRLAREKVTIAVQSPHAGSGTPFGGGTFPDFFWPVVITLSVVAFGLSM